MSQDNTKYREEAERLLNGDNNKWEEPFSYKLAVEVLAKVLEDKDDCEGCRILQYYLAESYDLNTAQAKKISELQNQLTETNELCEARLKNIIILKKQLTEAQGKSGKVVSEND